MGAALDNLREFFKNKGLSLDRKSFTTLLALVMMLVLLPVGIFLVRNRTVFFPMAAGELIQLGEGGCIKLDKNKKKVVDCATIPLKLINPFFNVSANSGSSSPSTSSPTPGVSSVASASVAASSSPTAPPVRQTLRVNGNTNTEIQAALDQLKTSGGAVYLPAGTYTINNKIQLYSNVTLFGDGIDQTILNAGIAIDTEEAVVGNSTSEGQANIGIRDLTIKGHPEGSGEGIKLRNLSGGFVYNVKVEGTNTGILLGFHNGQGVYSTRISNCQINNTVNHGIFMSLGENNVIDNCTVNSGGSDSLGIGLEIGVTGKIANNKVINNTVTGGGHSYSFTAGNGSQFESSWMNANNIVCYNKASGNHIDQIWDLRGTNNVYVGNNVSVSNVNSFGFEEKSGTDPRCDIPASYSIPPIPTKPSASTGDSIFHFLANLLKKSLIKNVYALGLAPELQKSPYKNMLVSYWKFDETSGNSVADTNFQSLQGPGTGTGTTIVEGKFGKARMIPTGGFISLPNIPEYGDNVMSVAAWIKPVSFTGGASIWNQPEGTSLEFSPEGDGTMQCFIKPIRENQEGAFSIKSSGGDKVSLNAWNHVACTFDMDTLKLYINGRMVASGARRGWLNQPRTSQPVLIGKNIASGQIINGAVDDLAYWNRALADSEVASIYNNGQGQAIDLSAAASPAASDNSDDQFTSGSPSPASGSSTGPGVVRYRLAESQAGLNSAQWREFALVPTQTKFASNRILDWLTGLFSPVFAQDSDDKFTGTTYNDSEDNFIGSPLPSGSGPGSSGTPSYSLGKQFITTNYQLANSTPGTRQIWVQYIHPDGSTRVDKVTFDFVDKLPQITGLACNLDISKQNLKITVDGNYFGTAIGTVSTVTPSGNTEILAWNNNQITALLKSPNISITQGQRYTVKVARPDGFESGTAVCAVDKSLVSLGARIFCREPGKFDASDVAVTLLYNDTQTGGTTKLSKVEEKVTINKDGEIENLKTQLQAGKDYALSIKAPNSLRRSALFKASEGTTQITNVNGEPFILPIGDIAPKISTDGQINTLDRAELIRQWKVLGQGDTKQTGDFNRDGRVNSIDWACMQYDFGSSDDPVLVEVPQPASGTIKIQQPASGTITIPISSPTPRSSVSSDRSNSVNIFVDKYFEGLLS